MLELKRKTISFKLNEEVHEVGELTVSELEELNEFSLKENLTELKLYRKMLSLAGLEDNVISTMTLSMMKKISDALTEAK